MGILENVITAFQNVLGNKMRSGLTMLGIIIGIGAVIMITSIGKGLENQTSDQLSQFGLEALIVSAKVDADTIESDLLTMDDVSYIEPIEQITAVTPFVYGSGFTKEKDPNEKITLSITGTSHNYVTAQPITLLHGRFLSPMDIENSSNVVVIDQVLARKMFTVENCVGQKMEITIKNNIYDFTIIGVIKGIDYGGFFEMARVVYIPAPYLLDILDQKNISNIYVNMTENIPAISASLMNEVGVILRVKHQNQDRYSIQNLQEQMEDMGNMLGYITGFVALVASISLIVGGIGVMNIMLVTVTERTTEIGIRKSLGATDRNIQVQFLIEAVILTVIGGVIGIGIGYLGAVLVGDYLNLLPVVSTPVLLGTMAISSAIGIIFGVYPANQAAKLDPIEALRYE